MSDSSKFVTPVGRMVQGSATELTKSGIEGKKDRMFVALAIPKNHPDTTKFIAQIDEAIASFFPGVPKTSLHTKIKDGDSEELDDNGRRWCDKAGFAGHWVVNISGMNRLPRLVDTNGQLVRVVDHEAKEMFRRGNYFRVVGWVKKNNGMKGSGRNKGLFINLQAIQFVDYGEEIDDFDANVFNAAAGLYAQQVNQSQPRQQQQSAETTNQTPVHQRAPKRHSVLNVPRPGAPAPRPTAKMETFWQIGDDWYPQSELTSPDIGWTVEQLNADGYPSESREVDVGF